MTGPTVDPERQARAPVTINLTAHRLPAEPRIVVAIIHTSPLPEVDIPEVTITSHVLRRSVELADRVAIRDAAGTSSYTFAELKAAIASLAGGLVAKGFGPGSVLGLMAPNIPEYAIVFHGVATAGGAVTTINPTYGANEVRFQLQDAGASILVTIPMFLDTALEAMEGTDVKEVYVLGGGEGARPHTELFGAPIDPVPVGLDDTVVLPYSSGTTGLPKGVMLTHRNLVANIEQCRHAIFYKTDPAARDAVRVAESTATLRECYAELDARLAGCEWFCGDYGVADITIFLCCMFGATLGVPVGDTTPHLATWIERMNGRPAVAAEAAEMMRFAATLPPQPAAAA